jgi:stringent starvation protein B
MKNEDVIMSQKPYLIRAMYEWMLDFRYTPRLVICPLVDGVVLPGHLTHQNQVTLDISPHAITGLMLGNDKVVFEAYFDKEPYEISLPMNCIGAIIAKEKEVGYVFDIDDFIPANAARDMGSATEEIATLDSNPTAGVVKERGSERRAEKSETKRSSARSGEKKKKPSLSRKSQSSKNNSFSSILGGKKRPARLSKKSKNSDSQPSKKKKTTQKDSLLSSLRKKIKV